MEEAKRFLVQVQVFDLGKDPQAVSAFLYQYQNVKFISQVSLGNGLVSVAYEVIPDDYVEAVEKAKREAYKQVPKAEKDTMTRDTRFRLTAVSIAAIVTGLIGLVEKSNNGFLYVAFGILAVIYLFVDGRKNTYQPKKKAEKGKKKKTRKRKNREVEEDDEDEMDQ